MMVALALRSYLPLAELARIVAVTIAVAVLAPSAVSLAVVGLDRRAAGSGRLGGVLVGAGASVLVVLVASGLYALVDR